MSPRTKTAGSESYKECVEQFDRMVAADKDLLDDASFADTAAAKLMEAGARVGDLVLLALRARLGETKLLGVLEQLQHECRPVVVLSRPFPLNGQGLFAHARPLSSSAAPDLFRVVDEELGRALGDEALDLPCFGMAELSSRALLGLLPAEAPGLPLEAEILTAKAAWQTSSYHRLGEVEVFEGEELEGRTRAVCCSDTLAGDIASRLEAGDSVSVRVSAGFVGGVHETSTGRRPRYEEELPLDGPRLGQLVLRRRLREQLDGDLDKFLSGHGLLLNFTGFTGLGKTEGARRLLREAGLMSGKPVVLHTATPASIGSAYIHMVAHVLGRMEKRARKLAGEGYVVGILVDEAPALLGTLDGGHEHSYVTEERLTGQSLFSKPIPGVAVILTQNVEARGLSAAMDRRFDRREFERPTRSQMARVASLYATDETLARLGTGREEFGGRVADNLFAPERILAHVHYYSGETRPVRARDLQSACPGKLERLVGDFCLAVEKGRASSLEWLFEAFDREFTGGDLSTHNLYSRTFLVPAASSELRAVVRA